MMDEQDITMLQGAAAEDSGATRQGLGLMAPEWLTEWQRKDAATYKRARSAYAELANLPE